MILIQVILIGGFISLLILFLKRQSSYQLSAWSKIFMMFFVIVSVFVVIFPNTSNTIAHVVGVTRGADLLLYMLTLSFIFVVLNLYANRKYDQKRLVLLARKVALLEAEIRYRDKKHVFKNHS